MSRLGTNLEYSVEREKFNPDVCVIASGSIRLRVYRRRMKYDGWNGYEAYAEECKNPYAPKAAASRWSALLRKLEKLEGVRLKA